VRYIGRTPATLATTAEATKVVKDLVAGRTVDYNGKTFSIPWAEGRGWDLPVWMAGYGPKALASTGTHYDGFILQLADPQVVAWTIGAVRQAAEEAGRDPDSLTICVAAPAYVGDDVTHQRDEVRWFGGMVGNHVHDMVKRYGSDESKVPKVLADYIAAREGYDYAHHGKASNTSTDFVPDEIVDRFCLLGPPAAHLERLAELRELGVDQFAVYLMHDDMEGTLEAYGREIIPAMG
jgi:probable F420-dependent oxidoreductase